MITYQRAITGAGSSVQRFDRSVSGAGAMTFALLAMAGVAAVVAGCSGPPSKVDLTWTESVRLSSGDEITIKRHVIMSHPRALGGGFSSAATYSTSTVESASAAEPFSKWDAPLVPLLLDRDPQNGEWIIVASIDGCLMWLRNGLPRPPYWAFRHRNDRWYRDEIPESFLMRASNLLVDFDVDDKSSRLTSEAQARKDSQAVDRKHAPHYGKIDANFTGFEGCGRDRPSRPVGIEELDLTIFGRLQ